MFGILVSFQIADGVSAFIVGMFFLLLALYSISKLKETFGKDLNSIEGGEIV
jgi:uncharacterized membrane protein